MNNLLKVIREKSHYLYGLGASLFATALFYSDNLVISLAKDAQPKNSFLKKITKKLIELRSDIVIFGTAIASVCIVVALIFIGMSKDPKKVGSAWDWLKRVVIIYIALGSVTVLLPELMNFAIK